MHDEEMIFRNKLIRTLNNLVYAVLWIGICLLCAYFALTGRVDLP